MYVDTILVLFFESRIINIRYLLLIFFIYNSILNMHVSSIPNPG